MSRLHQPTVWMYFLGEAVLIDIFGPIVRLFIEIIYHIYLSPFWRDPQKRVEPFLKMDRVGYNSAHCDFCARGMILNPCHLVHGLFVKWEN